jgi:hypothetical protein
MSTVKQVINNMLDTLPEFQLMEVVDYVAFIKTKNEKSFDSDLTDKNLAGASLSSMDFWDNPIDDEVWNDV